MKYRQRIQKKRSSKHRKYTPEDNEQNIVNTPKTSIEIISRKPKTLWNENDILTAHKTLGNTRTTKLLKSPETGNNTHTIQRSFEDTLNFWKGLESQNQNSETQQGDTTQNSDTTAKNAPPETTQNSGGKLTQQEFDQQIASGRRDFSGADLSGLNLSNKDLVGLDFSGANFNRTLFINAKIHASNFTGADFELAIASNASFIASNLTDANMKGIFANGTEFTGTKFNGADLSNASFMNTNIVACDFGESTQLTGADFTNAQLMNTQLTNMDLSHVNFTSANMLSSDLSGSKLINTMLNAANLMSANFTNAIVVTQLTLGTNFSGAIFIGATVDINFHSIIAQGADFSTVTTIPPHSMFFLAQNGAKTLYSIDTLQKMMWGS